MATMTAAEIRDMALEHIGVKAAGQSASAEDASLTEKVITAVVSRFARDGLITFAESAVPEWAQLALRDLVAFEISPSFGVPKNYDEERAAKATLAAQTSGVHDARVITPIVFY